MTRMNTVIVLRILFQQVKKKPRARILQFWIDTASECLNMGNFNSLMAIVSGLNMAPIARLKKTVSCSWSSSCLM